MVQTINGYPVIEGKPTGEREWLIIADRGYAYDHDRFVVWRVFRRDDAQMIASAGYYTSDYRAAQFNMDERG